MVDEVQAARQSQMSRSGYAGSVLSARMRCAFGSVALASVGLGFGVYLLAERLSIDPETAGLIAQGFIAAAAIDTVVLYAWDRLFSNP